MAKSKAAHEQRRGTKGKAIPAARKSSGKSARTAAGSEVRSATYEQSMKAYRSASRRYRKTLDDLAK